MGKLEKKKTNQKMKLAATLVVVASAGKVTDPVKQLNKLRGHADTLLDLADNNTTTSDKNIARAEKWVNKVFDNVSEIDNSCLNPSSSARKTSASLMARSELLSDLSSNCTAALVLSPKRTSSTFLPSEPAECKTSSPESPTARHLNNSFTFLFLTA